MSLKNANSLHIYNKVKISKYCKSYLCDIKNYNKLYNIFDELQLPHLDL